MSKNKQNTQAEVFGNRESTPTVASDTAKSVDVRVNSDAAKKRLGRDIYTSRSRAFEEMTANGITAVQEAEDEEYIDSEEGVLEIQAFPSRDGSQYCLRVIDNGIGMTEKVIREVFVEFGVTTFGSDETKMGSFGMGVASYPNLVGFDDGVIYVETHSRKTGEAVSGRYTIDDFVYETGTDNLQFLSEDEYGTVLDMWLLDEIGLRDIKSWVEGLTEENPIPILFRYQTPNGQTQKEEYDVTPINERIDSTEATIRFENELVEVVAGQSVPDKTVILHKEIDWDSRFSSGPKVPFKDNIYVRFKTESVQECEGEQKLILSDKEYEAKNQSVKSKYKPKSKIQDDMPLTPRVVGNREQLADEYGCGAWIARNLRDTLISEFKSILSGMKSVSDYVYLSGREEELLDICLRNVAFSRSHKYKNPFKYDMGFGTTKSSVKSFFEGKYGIILSDEKAELFSAMFGMDFVGPHSETLGFEVEKKRQVYDTDVYIGCSIDNKKRRVVKDHDSNTIVLKVNSAKCYTKYQQAFGWKLLKNIKKSRLDEFDISEEVRKLFETQTKDASETVTGVTVPDENLTIHYGRRQRQKKKGTVKYVYNQYHNGGSVYKNNKLVLFTPDSSYNLSDCYEYIEGRSFGIANASVEAAEALTELEGVWEIDDIVTHHSTVTVPTTNGAIELGDVISDDSVSCIVTQNEQYTQLEAVTQNEAKLAQRIQETLDNHNELASAEGAETIAFFPVETLVSNKFVFLGNEETTIYTTSDATLHSVPISQPSYSRNHSIQMDEKTLLMAVGLSDYAKTPVYPEILNCVHNYTDLVQMCRYHQQVLSQGFTDHRNL